MNQTVSFTENATRVDHPDGGCTIVVRHLEWTATIVLDAYVVRRMRDRRRGGGSYSPATSL